jgi:hypothetical protein
MRETSSRHRSRIFLALLGLAAIASASGCAGGNAGSELRAARLFQHFPLHWLGERFEHLRLTAIQGLDGPSGFVTLVYGSCRPHGGDEPSCTPPLELQISPLCLHLRAVARAPIWRHRRIRGAPVGTIDAAPVLFSRRVQLKVYRGEGSDAGLPQRALKALRSLNRLPLVIGPSDSIPPPAPGVLERTRPCRARRAAIRTRTADRR